jgi:hypothetical protein
MVVVRVPEVFKDVIFICLNMVTRPTFSAKKDNKTGIKDVSLKLIIKSE